MLLQKLKLPILSYPENPSKLDLTKESSDPFGEVIYRAKCTTSTKKLLIGEQSKNHNIMKVDNLRR